MTFIETAYNYVAQGLAPIVSSAALTTHNHHFLQTRSLEKRYDLCYTDPFSGTTYYCNGGSHCTSDFTCSSNYYWTGGVAGGVLLLICIVLICLRRRRQRLAMMGGPMVVTTVIPSRDNEAQPQVAAAVPQPQYASYPPPQPYDAYGQPGYGPSKDQQPPMGYAPPANTTFAAPAYPSPSIVNNSPYSQPAQTPSVAPASPYPGQPQSYGYAQPAPYPNETVTYVPSPQK